MLVVTFDGYNGSRQSSIINMYIEDKSLAFLSLHGIKNLIIITYIVFIFTNIFKTIIK